MDAKDAVPVIEIGGTHLTAALVEAGVWSVIPGSLSQAPLDAHAGAPHLIDAVVSAASTLGGRHRSEWVVAIPGPFDYERGVGRFQHVGKFESLFGLSLRDELMSRILPTPDYVHFLNDADAFGLGEYALGSARNHDRAVCITLGTGIGSAFLCGGEPINSGPLVPPDGSAHLLQYQGRPLEETVSRRAIRAVYAQKMSLAVELAPDVREIAQRSRDGDSIAQRVLHDSFNHLGAALAETLMRFHASVLVVGGSMARSWDIVEPALREGLVALSPSLRSLVIAPAQHPVDGALIGAAYWGTKHAL